MTALARVQRVGEEAGDALGGAQAFKPGVASSPQARTRSP